MLTLLVTKYQPFIRCLLLMLLLASMSDFDEHLLLLASKSRNRPSHPSSPPCPPRFSSTSPTYFFCKRWKRGTTKKHGHFVGELVNGRSVDPVSKIQTNKKRKSPWAFWVCTDPSIRPLPCSCYQFAPALAGKKKSLG